MASSNVSHAYATDTINLLQLLKATENPKAASADLGSYVYPNPSSMKQDVQAVWPIYSFLWAEIYRLRGDQTQARRIYRNLVEWSAQDPYKDYWGGSGLVVVSLWRWVQLADANSGVPQQEKEALVTMASKLWKDQPRLDRGMFQTLPWLSALPQMKENLLRGLSSLAWSLNKKEEAQRFFIEYLTVSSTGQLTPSEQQLFDEAPFSQPKVALFLGARLQKLGDYQGASHWLHKARDSGKAQVRAEASLHLALLRRLHGEKCLTDKVRDLLDTAINESTDPEVIQRGLFLQAKIAIREGCSKDYSLFKKNLLEILKDFPRGRRADDALNQLACYHLNRYRDRNNLVDLEAALRLFARLRQNYPDREAHIDSSWFKPAMTLYIRGKPENLRDAADFLKELEKARPNGPLHLAALFWLGRIAAESGQKQEAEKYFQTIIDECPFDYYAIRARMHQNLGNQASKKLNPDDKTRKDLEAAYLRSKKQHLYFSEKSPYHQRLHAAVQSGIYYRALRYYIDCRKKEFPSDRLERISLIKLDEFHRLPHVALVLALRQDALAAIDLPPVSKNRLEVASALSELKGQDWPHGDWPLVIYISGALGRPYEVKSQTQNDPAYLAIAHPKIFRPLINKYAKSYRLPGALLYAVIRHESVFNPTALSPDGALGLFQFIPSTFKTLDERWKLLRKRKKSSREEFLLDADANIYLGARWFREELLPSQDNNLLWALMEHNAGAPAVKEWKEKWRRQGRSKDYEFMLETVRFGETRGFVRRVLPTYWIIQATGLY